MCLTNHSSAFLLHDVRVVKNVACLSFRMSASHAGWIRQWNWNSSVASMALQISLQFSLTVGFTISRAINSMFKTPIISKRKKLFNYELWTIITDYSVRTAVSRKMIFQL